MNTANTIVKHCLRLAAIAAVAGLGAACSGNYAAKPDTAPQSGPKTKRLPSPSDSVFGPGGASIGSLVSPDSGDQANGKGHLPVNKYLWQASLDTLSFLPLASTDPFTGVIATDWGSTPEAPGERFKVTAYILNPGLTAAALKVAVYRETRNGDGVWVPAQVSPDTARQLEDAILTRARQIRMAEKNAPATG